LKRDERGSSTSQKEKLIEYSLLYKVHTQIDDFWGPRTSAEEKERRKKNSQKMQTSSQYY